MDDTLFNLTRFVYFSVEPAACGTGKSSSRFGSELHACEMGTIAAQLACSSLFTHDFATRPPESSRALLCSSDGSTGLTALDERLTPSPGREAAPLDDRSLTQVALALYEHAPGRAQRALRDAIDVYRYADEPEELASLLAQAVEHRTAFLCVHAEHRLRDLRTKGLEQTPAASALTQLLRRLEHCLAHPDDTGCQNFLMNGIGLRPQVIVPGSVILPA